MRSQTRQPALACPLIRVILALAVSFGAIAAAFAAEPHEEQILLTSDAPLTVLRGEIDVPENRTNAQSRTISIGYRRIPATEGATGPAAYLLAGGPGGSYNERLDEKSARRERAVALIEMFRQIGDVVLVDLRGVNYSTPNALCPKMRSSIWALNKPSGYADMLRNAGARCREKLIDEGFDLSGYTPIDASNDIIAVADFFGDKKIILYGKSWGSHLGLTIINQHPHRVARALLEGVEGPDHTIDDTHAVLATVKRIATEAQMDPDVAAVFPDGIVDTIGALATKADDGALKSGPFGLLGMRFRSSDFSTALFYGLDYGLNARRTMPAWPSAMARLAKGNFNMLAGGRLAVASGVGGGWDAAAIGMHDCASWISEERKAHLAGQTEWLTSNLSTYSATCAGWQVDDLGKDFRADFQSDTPVLLFAGTYDTSTPIENAYEVAKFFTNGHLTVVEGGSHDAFRESLDADATLVGIVTSWLQGEDVTPPDIIRLPPLEFEPLN